MFDPQSRCLKVSPPPWETPEMEKLRTDKKRRWPDLPMECYTPFTKNTKLWLKDKNTTPPKWLIRGLRELSQIHRGTREPYVFKAYPRGEIPDSSPPKGSHTIRPPSAPGSAGASSEVRI